MKKSLMLFIAAGLVALMTGCGGGSSSASSKASTVNNTLPAPEVAFDVAPDTTSGTNVTYSTTATGDFPPAPPSSELAAVQEAANAKL